MKAKLEIENKGEENKSSTFFFYTENFDFPCFIKEKIKVIKKMDRISLIKSSKKLY